jgi:hypothetical protein
MAQRSIHAVTKVHYGSYARLRHHSNDKVSSVVCGTTAHLAPCEPRRVTTPISHSSEQGTQTVKVATFPTVPDLAQTIASNLTTVTSHHDGWKTNTLSTHLKPNSTSQRWKDLYDTHNCMAKHNQLMHAASVYYREKAYWNKMVKSHLPCSPTGCCSKSWKLSSQRFTKSSAPNDSNQKQAIVNK